MVDDGRIIGAEDFGDGRREVAALDQSDMDRVLDIAADVGNHVGDAYDTGFEGLRNKIDADTVFKKAATVFSEHLLRSLPSVWTIAVLQNLSIVTDNAVQGLDREIDAGPVPLDFVEETDPLDVVIEASDAFVVTDRVDHFFTEVAKGGMSDVMAEGDGLDQVFVEGQGAPDGAPDPGDELDVQDSMRDVVVLKNEKTWVLSI